MEQRNSHPPERAGFDYWMFNAGEGYFVRFTDAQEKIERLRAALENIAAMRDDIHTVGNARYHARRGLDGPSKQALLPADSAESNWQDSSGKWHSYKCGLNPNPHAAKHMVNYCTCPPDSADEGKAAVNPETR